MKTLHIMLALLSLLCLSLLCFAGCGAAGESETTAPTSQSQDFYLTCSISDPCPTPPPGSCFAYNCFLGQCDPFSLPAGTVCNDGTPGHCLGGLCIHRD